MGSYYYKTSAHSVLDAVAAWDAKRAAFHAQRIKLGQMFGGDASPMYSGGDNYVGGVKLSTDRELDVHWRRPDGYGYRALRNAAKPEKGASKEARAALKLEHERLVAQWQEHCPARISKDDAWKAIGIDWGSIFLNGGVFFISDITVFLNLGFQLKPEGEKVEGAIEILSSEYETARDQVHAQRKAA